MSGAYRFFAAGLPGELRFMLRAMRSRHLACIGFLASLLGAGLAVADDIAYAYDEAGRLVQVTTPAGSAQYRYDTAGNLIAVERPSAGGLAIAEFTPNGGPVGSIVTISGSGFSSTPSSNTVRVNGTAATVTQAGAGTLKITVPTGATTGRISVTVAGDTVTSTQDFTVGAAAERAVPAITGFAPQVAAVGDTITLTGDRLVQSGTDTWVRVNGLPAEVVSATDTQVTFKVPVGATSGYVALGTADGSVRSATVLHVAPTGYAASDVAVAIAAAPDGATRNLAIPAGKIALVSFAPTVGKGYGLAWRLPTTTPVAIKLLSPSGQLLYYCASSQHSCDYPDGYFTVAGQYTFVFDPEGTAAVAFDTILTEDAGGGADLPIDATDGTTVSIGRAGQNALYTFRGTKGQNLNLVLTDHVITHGVSGEFQTYVYVYRPLDPKVYAGTNNTQNYLKYFAVPANGGTASVELPNLPETGTYKVYVSPSALDEGSLKLRVAAEQAGEMVMNGSKQISLSVGQNGRYTFQGSRLKGYGLALTAMSGPTVNVSLQDAQGNQLDLCSAQVNGSCDFGSGRFLADATYALVFNPTTQAASSFTAVLSEDAGGSELAVNAELPTATSILRPGQNALYTFQGTKDEAVSVVLTGAALKDAQNVPHQAHVFLYPPSAQGTDSAAYVGFAPMVNGASATLDMAKLPETGTYKVYVSPQWLGQGSFDVRVTRQKPGELVVNGSTPITLMPGQSARYTFTAQARKGYGLALAGLSGASAVDVRLYDPSGTQIVLKALGEDSCDFGDKWFEAAGEYAIVFDPIGEAATSFTAVFSSDKGNGSVMTPGATPTQVVIDRVGQNALYTFDGTQGQHVVLSITGNTLDDGTTSNPQAAVYVYKPSDPWVDGAANDFMGTTFTTGTTSKVLDLGVLPETGRYKVYITPGGLDKGQLNLTVSIPPPADGDVPLPGWALLGLGAALVAALQRRRHGAGAV